jgi:5-methyltetrahydrofolate--homocysteine methyltransferase
MYRMHSHGSKHKYAHIHMNAASWYPDGLGPNPSPEQLLREEYAGIRPAVGYPSIPDQRVLGHIWDALDMEKRPHLGVTITDSYALDPEAAVAGLVFSHRESKYFSVGKISLEQLADYADRGGETVSEAKMWLPNSLLVE